MEDRKWNDGQLTLTVRQWLSLCSISHLTTPPKHSQTIPYHASVCWKKAPINGLSIHSHEQLTVDWGLYRACNAFIPPPYYSDHGRGGITTHPWWCRLTKYTVTRGIHSKKSTINSIQLRSLTVTVVSIIWLTGKIHTTPFLCHFKHVASTNIHLRGFFELWSTPDATEKNFIRSADM